jgi:hypothetical protein
LIANCGAKVRRFFDTLVSQIAAVFSLFAENVRLFINKCVTLPNECGEGAYAPHG